MIKLNGHVITPTIFPDKTSQVWKIDPKVFDDQHEFHKNVIQWDWEGDEAELIHVNLLICLLNQMNQPIGQLFIPYLPYARQDKEVSNDATFAKHVFLELLLKEHVHSLTTIDAHSPHDSILSFGPMNYIAKIINNYDVIVYPDKGAYDRYHEWVQTYHWDKKIVVLDKVRNQLTGKIEGLEINKELSTFEQNLILSNAYNALIIDDICDGGMTYIKATQYLHEQYAHMNIDLYITHGIFSKGVEVLYESGIRNVYTTNTLSIYREKQGIDNKSINVIE